MFNTKNIPILVIDNDFDQAELTKEILLQAEYTVVTAPNAEVGLQLNELYYPFLIITDFSMPGIDGGEFIKQLRQRGHYQVPVIMLSAHSREYINQAMQPGYSFNLLLSKPLDFDLLLAMVNSYHQQYCELIRRNVWRAA